MPDIVDQDRRSTGAEKWGRAPRAPVPGRGDRTATRARLFTDNHAVGAFGCGLLLPGCGGERITPTHMARASRLTALFAISLGGTLAACVAAGCAASGADGDDLFDGDASASGDAAKKDARAVDGSTSGDDDSGAGGEMDAGAKDAG
ncbi:MAG TPA: hypothetical protein VM204_09440, partial [Gaiellaceae bacterium]|nr:hypothetical protein [Gaiellaceae bacterium]